jgi:hypothetical protein
MNKSKIFSIFLSGLALLFISGCTQDLNRSKAEELIRKSKSFQKSPYSTVVLVGAVQKQKLSNKYSETSYKQAVDLTSRNVLERFGLVTVSEDSKNIVVSLTGKGKQQAIALPARDVSITPLFIFEQPTSYEPIQLKAYEFPAANYESPEVTGIRKDSENSATVEFHRKVVPNELGKALLAAYAPNTADAKAINWIMQDNKPQQLKFEQFDDGWRVVDTPQNK